MRMRPTSFVVPKSGDPFENDKLGRKDQIKSLTQLIRNIEGPCVLAIDGAWGSGKTVFLKMWAQFLRRHRFRVAELNAWETDFSDDPLIVLYAALEDELGKSSKPKNKKALVAGAKLVSRIISDAVPLIPDVADAVDTAKNRSKKPIETRLALLRETEEAIEEFKDTLRIANKDRLPFVIFVDELDRCRPDYAIRFLEATKHIFDVEGIVFILGVNLSELAHSVSALHGTDFDGETYLRRFVDRSIYIPQADRVEFFENLLDQTKSIRRVRHHLETFILGASNLSLRDMEQGIYHLGTVMETIPVEHRAMVPLDELAATLVIVQMADLDTYRHFLRGECSDLDVVTTLYNFINRPSDWWKAPHIIDRISAGVEAILVGYHKHINRSWEMDTPLLQKRSEELEKEEYNMHPQSVVSSARMISDYNDRSFSRVLSIVEMITYEPPS